MSGKATGILPALVFFVFCTPVMAAQPEQTPATSVELLTSDIQVSADGSEVQTIHIELHASNEAGALRASQINVPFSAGIQQLDILEAHTLKADGSKIPVDTSTIYEQLPPQDMQLGAVTDERVKVLLFPRFAAGDTAVYTVRISTPHPIFSNAFYYGEVLPRAISYKEVRETITAPTAMNLRAEAHSVEYSKRAAGTNTIYSFHYSAPVAKPAEIAAVSPIDHEPRFFLSSFKSYVDLGRAYADLAQPKIVVTDKVKAIANEATAGLTDRRAQAAKLYEWVVKHVRYVAVELGRGTFVPHDVDTILANGYGDCKDHDVLLQALLKAKGIAAKSVLISSTDAYTLTNVPTFISLDHVITYVPEFDAYLDSNLPAAFGTLPLQEYGKPAVVNWAGGAQQISLPVVPAGLATITTKSVERIDQTGALSGTTTTTASGPYAITLRMIGLGVQAAGPEKAAEVLLAGRGFQNGTGQVTADPPNTFSDSYTISGQFSATGWSDWAAGKETGIMPGGMRVFSVTGDGPMGPFTSGDDTKTEDTVCVSAHEVEDVSLEAPPNMRFTGTPKDARVETDHLLFTAHWTLTNDTLAVHREFTSKIDSPLCTGQVRKDTAAALKKISDSYDVAISVTAATGATNAPDKASEEDADDLVKQAAELQAEGQYQAAIDKFGEALKLQPDNAEALVQMAGAYIDVNKCDRAEEAADKAVNTGKLQDRALLARGTAYGCMRKFDLAIADLDKAVTLNPKRPEPYMDRGLVYVNLGQVDRGMADLKRSLELNPSSAPAHFNLAIGYFKKNEFADALREMNQAIALEPQNANSYSFRGQIHWKLEQHEQAISDASQAISLNPDNATFYKARAWMRSYSNHPKEALADYNKALSLMPTDATTMLGRGYIYIRLHAYPDAMKDFDQALLLMPKKPNAYLARSDLYLARNQYALALADCNKAVELAPNLPGVYERRSEIEKAMGNASAAKLDADKATKLSDSSQYPDGND